MEMMILSPPGPPPAANIADILDIVANILTRLPVKSLLCFRAVSKPWCSLIDSPQFIKQHLQRSTETNTNQTLILRHQQLPGEQPCFSSIDCDNLENAVELHHPLNKESHQNFILGCCDGLVAFLCQSVDDIILWNPSTKQYRELPQAALRYHDGNYRGCDSNAFGFGYDSLSDDYKIVKIIQCYQGCHGDEFESRVQVFSLKTGYWRRIEDCAYYFDNIEAYGVFVSDSVHWLARKRPKSDIQDLIVAFDLRTEEFKEIDPLDHLDKGKEFYKYIVVLGGCLCITVLYIDTEDAVDWDGYKASHVDVWVMKDYGVRESLTKLFTVKNPENIGHLELVIPLMYSKCGKKVLLNLDGFALVWFDLTSKQIEDQIIINELPESFSVCMCDRSLVSPFPTRRN